jgi:DNA-directed RNA polymerase subunit omega
MIHPSYVDLMNVVNKGVEEGEEPVISSRYSIVMATSKRARQIIAGDEPMVRVKDKQKPLSIAVEEMNQDTLRILTDEERANLESKNEAENEETENVEE